MNMNMKLSLARVKLVRELGILRVEIPNTVGVKRIPKLRRLAEIRAILMGEKPIPEAVEITAQTQAAEYATSPETAAQKVDIPTPKVKEVEPEIVAQEDEPAEESDVIAPRVSTAHFYASEKPKGISRAKLNAKALDIINRFNREGLQKEDLTDEDKAALAGYSGCGGGLVHSDGREGSAYEYYTPKPIADGIWDALKGIGFGGGKVLDPCSGAGIFGATAPLNCVVDAVELDKDSATVNKLINGGAGYTVRNEPFESFASKTPDGIYDAVVTNVPFGEKSARGDNWKKDERYQDEPLEGYFILRALDKLKPNGLAAFITPMRVVGDPSMSKLRTRAAMKAEFLGAYRLPSGTFKDADTDTATDVIFFRKFSEEQAEIISGIDHKKKDGADALREAKVLWDTFISGKWFKEDGKPFVLGEFVAKDPNKFRDVDKVISNASLTDLREILQKRKLPSSRIDWTLLTDTAVEKVPDFIQYHDGDRITQDGMTLEMRNGIWVQIVDKSVNPDFVKTLANLNTPLTAFNAGVTWKQMSDCMCLMYARGMYHDIPDWMRRYYADTQPANPKTYLQVDGASRDWDKTLVALTVQYVMDCRAKEVGLNYQQEYPKLSKALEQSRISKAHAKKYGSFVSAAFNTAMRQYNKAKGFSDLWLGKVSQANPVNDELLANANSVSGRLLNLRYKAQSNYLNIEDVQQIMGKDFDPIASEDWCMTADGKKLIMADDYYVGNYGEFLRKIDKEIESCTNRQIKDKLIRQKLDAFNFVTVPDVSKLTFNMFSPKVTIEEKVKFLQEFDYPRAEIVLDNNEREQISVKVTNVKNYQDKLTNRLSVYLATGTMSLGSMTLPQGKTEAEAMEDLRQLCLKVNEQFNSWVRSNDTIMARLRVEAENPDNLEFNETEDGEDMQIPGMNPALKLRDYQCAFVRKMGRSFGGINGFGVGLGKTFSALAAVQHVQGIGAKKKTVFVVPNAVLSNWKKEASHAYTTIDDCLFVGLREVEGKMVSSSSYYEEDLQEILLNKHSKIFMTMECFQRIKLREETVSRFKSYLRSHDSTYAYQKKDKANEKAKNQLERYFEPYEKFVKRNQKSGTPYLEDMGIDSIVIDEAHFYKNSCSAPDSEGENVRYLAITPANARGVDMQMKTWYIRGKTEVGDGSLLLTATPVTNSPLEMYSMMSLAVGRERLNKFVGVNGADEFIKTVCEIRNDPDGETIDGIQKPQDIFVGLTNASLIRNALGKSATIKDASDIKSSVFVPDRDTHANNVTLADSTIERMQTYKNAYRYATIKAYNEKHPDRQKKIDDPDGVMEQAYNEMKALFKEEDDILGHPFNLISKMTNLIIDPELEDGSSRYVIAESDGDLARKVIAKFNALKKTEDRPIDRPNKYTAKDAIIGQRSALRDVLQEDGTKKKVRVDVSDITRVDAQLLDSTTILLDSQNYANQQAFEAIAEQMGLNLSVHGSPKLDALAENVSAELANPRGMISDGQGGTIVSPIVKQIIFCDNLALHSKIKKILAKRCGISTSKMAVITGQTNGSPDEIMDVQEGFNAQGEENRYSLIIANKKAEVGINLQKGTQAIHHLTIGWTPDSLEQRNGRGARQGNLTQAVAIYYYDADGTFDSVKRKMVGKKSDWIGDIMSKDGDEQVAISGGLTNEQIEELIDAGGDAEAVAKAQARREAEEAQRRAKSVRDRQTINIDTFMKRKKFIDENESCHNRVLVEAYKLYCVLKKIEKIDLSLKKKPKNDKERAKQLTDIQTRKELDASAKSIAKLIDDSARISRRWSRDITAMDFVAEASNDMKTPPARAMERFQKATDKEVIRRDFDINVRTGGPIYAQWQKEIADAKKMMEQAKRSFEELSKNDGAFPKDALEKIEVGNGAIFGGKFIQKGALFEVDGIIGCANKVSFDEISGIGYTELRNGYVLSPFFVENGKKYSVFQNGDVGYDAFCKRIADVEDAMCNGNTMMVEQANTVSNMCNDVAQCRTVEKRNVYSADRYLLPAPYFPIVITPKMIKDSKESKLLKEIAEKQKEVVRTVDCVGSENDYSPSYRFVVNEGAKVTDRDYQVETRKIFNTGIIEYAKASGYRLKWGDMYNNGSYVSSSDTIRDISNGVGDIEYSKVLDEINKAEAGKKVEAYVNALNNAISFFDFRTVKNSSDLESFDCHMTGSWRGNGVVAKAIGEDFVLEFISSCEGRIGFVYLKSVWESDTQEKLKNLGAEKVGGFDWRMSVPSFKKLCDTVEGSTIKGYHPSFESELQG